MNASNQIQESIAVLMEINGEDRCLLEDAALRAYYQRLTGRLASAQSHLPFSIIRPASLSQLTTTLGLLQKCAISAYTVPRHPVTTNRLATEPYVIIDLSLLDQILEIDDLSQTVTVQAGATYEVIEAALQARDYTLRFHPSCTKGLTLGACFSSGEWGHQVDEDPRLSAQFMAVTAVLPDGTVFQTTKTPRSAAGPSLSKVLMGSCDRLCVIASMTLGIFPKGERHILKLFHSESVEQALDACRICLQSRIRPIELIVTPDPIEVSGWLVMAKFEGTVSIVESQEAAYSKRMSAQGLTEVESDQIAIRTSLISESPQSEESNFQIAFRTDWRHMPELWKVVRSATVRRKPGYIFSGLGCTQLSLHVRLATRDLAQARIARTLILDVEQLGIPFQVRCPSVKGIKNQFERELLVAMKKNADRTGILNPGEIGAHDWK